MIKNFLCKIFDKHSLSQEEVLDKGRVKMLLNKVAAFQKNLCV
ncbi:hypothetical protein B488_03010 [Liberibacter crescens BT-1]|uniref:Uncharacterized protein n=1 Tax=Liberibacter crescens (strain BT-1) TaxID=1215343 RepID=L0ES19_LIBCB|nr:hypothetical protein B488_03010 [Liberibacter crescens BT-1]